MKKTLLTQYASFKKNHEKLLTDPKINPLWYTV